MRLAEPLYMQGNATVNGGTRNGLSQAPPRHELHTLETLAHEGGGCAWMGTLGSGGPDRL